MLTMLFLAVGSTLCSAYCKTPETELGVISGDTRDLLLKDIGSVNYWRTDCLGSL